jgi:tetratricopeptide (TPR) repeat protein
MAAALRLLITDYHSPDRFAWRLEDAHSNTLAYHEVKLDVSEASYRGYADLPAYLKHYRAIHAERKLLADAGDWMGQQLFGPILPAILKHPAPPVTTVAVVAPPQAQDLLARPLELARHDGKPLTQHKIRLIYERKGATPSTAKTTGNPLRVLAVFSLPEVGSPLNLRRERYALEQFVRNVQAEGKAIQLRVLQYGATRQTLREALEEGEGWDILHFSGHGHNGVLALERTDGTPDVVTAEELETLLDDVKGRVQLLFLSACLSGATSVRAARRALGLDAPVRDQADATEDEAAAQATQLPSLGQRLAERLDCAALAMRYSVGNRFAIDLANRLYEALLTDRQPLPRALHTALTDACTPEVEAALPLSGITPILFGPRAAALRLVLPERDHDGILPHYGMAAFPSEPERFVGRLRAMIAGREALAEGGKWRGILYYGMAGAGKTTLATELAYRYREGRFRGFVWHVAPSEGSDISGAFARFLDALYTQLELTDTSLLAYADRPTEFNKHTLPRLREYLRRNACLIVLDNLEGLLTSSGDWLAPEWGPLLEALLDRQSRSRLILTSRRIPKALAVLPQLKPVPVHALSLSEAVLLARDLPNLNELFADADGQRLLVWTLRLVQGHPKLLEFADHLAADRSTLQAQLTGAEDAAEGQAILQAFFETGKTAREEAQFLQAFSRWTADLTEQCTPSVRLLFRFLACLEDEDRNPATLAATWPVFLENLPDGLPGLAEAQTDATQALQAGLRELTGCGLIEQQVRYGMHPAVAEAARRAADSRLRSAADNTMAGLHMAYVQHFRDRETEGYTSALTLAAQRALPYLVRQQEWNRVASMAQEIVFRDQSPATLALALPLLERAAEAEADAGEPGSAAGVLARTLWLAGRHKEAETRLRELISRAAARGDYQTASVAAGELANLLRQTGRQEEALASVEQEIAYASQAGTGPWTQLLAEAKRLQIGNELGRRQETLTEGEALLTRMTELSETILEGQYESVRPYSVREFLLDTVRSAALYTEQYERALELNAAIVQSVQDRNADALEIAQKRFNDYGPLLRLRRYAEAHRLLQECREAFAEAGADMDLGRVYSALADLEDKQGNSAAAIQFEWQALLHRYRAASPSDCAISHNNLAAYYHRQGQMAEAQAHHLAAGILRLQIQHGTLQDSLHNLAQTELSGEPPNFDRVADTVEQVPGVRFRELFARLPQRFPDGDTAIAAVWEMARQQQQAQRAAQEAQRAAVEAVVAALEAGDEAAFNTALQQLPEEEAQAVVRKLTEAANIADNG